LTCTSNVLKGDYSYLKLICPPFCLDPTQPGGCCADTLRMVAKADGAVTDIKLDAILENIFADVAETDSGSTPWAYANHAFDLTTLGPNDGASRSRSVRL
jgi:hypothetical protein